MSATSEGEFNPTYRCLFPEPPPPGTVPACAEAGVMGALAGMLGSMMALEAIREIVGFGESLVGRLVMVDARAMRFETLALRARSGQPAQRRYAHDHRFERATRRSIRRALVSPLLAVEMRHLLGGVARAGGGARRKCVGERRQMRRRQFDVERAERLRQPVASARADQRHDVVALRGDPGDRDLRRRCTDFAGDGAQAFDQRQICVEIAALEARASRGGNPAPPSGPSTSAR